MPQHFKPHNKRFYVLRRIPVLTCVQSPAEGIQLGCQWLHRPASFQMPVCCAQHFPHCAFADILILTTGLIGFNGNAANMRFSHTILLGSSVSASRGVSYAARADIFRAYEAPEPAYNNFQFGVAAPSAGSIPVASELALPQVPAVMEALPVPQQAPAPAPTPAPAPAPTPSPAPAPASKPARARAPAPAPKPVAVPVPAPAPAQVEEPVPLPVGSTSWAAIAGKKGAEVAAAPSNASANKRRARRSAPKAAAASAPAAAAPAAEAKAKAPASKDAKAPATSEGRQRGAPSERRARVSAAGSVRVVGELAAMKADDVKAAFATFGRVVSMSAGTMGNGFCFVDFETAAAVQAAAAAGTVSVKGVSLSVEVNRKFDANRQAAKSGGRRAGSGGSRQPRQRSAPSSGGQ